MKIVVVGGGISGLAAAWELSADPSLEVTVLESAERLGGKIRTSPFAGREVDEGADAFLRRVPDALRLCAEIGLDDLVSPAHGTACVWLDGALRPLPSGLVLGVPAQFEPLEASAILTPWGLARARVEPDLDGVPLEGDTSVGELVRRRYGNEVADRLVGPLLGGINAGSIDSMSVDAVVPQLAAAAHGSASLSTALAASLPPSRPGGATPVDPVFAAPSGGMGELVDKLAAAVAARGVAVQLGRAVDVLPAADGVVLTTPADVSARLLRSRSPRAAEVLGSIEFASVVFTTLAFHRADVPGDLDASGFLVPRDAGLTVTAASWSSTKWARLAGDPVILRVSMGHADDHAPIGFTDDEVLERIAADLRVTMGITAAPVEHRIARYPNGFPQYRVGHLDRVAELEAHLLEDAPDLAVCGMAHRGVGIPACIREARSAAAALHGRLGGPLDGRRGDRLAPPR